MRHLPLAIALVAIAGCATVTMPDNVQTAPRKNGSPTIDSIDFSYASPTPFARLQRCVAMTISNNPISLIDAAGSYLSPNAMHYYAAGNAQTVQGGSAITYADLSQGALVAHGNIVAGPAAGGLTTDIISFDLHAVAKSTRTQLQFVNISQAQKDTGTSVNAGFYPIGTHAGAYPMQAYNTLQTLADRIKACARS